MADLEEFRNFRAETQRTLIRTTGVVRIRCMLKQGKENERDVVSTYSSIYIMPCSIALAIAMLDRGKPHTVSGRAVIRADTAPTLRSRCRSQ
jgi:hypothetical protein